MAHKHSGAFVWRLFLSLCVKALGTLSPPMLTLAPSSDELPHKFHGFSWGKGGSQGFIRII